MTNNKNIFILHGTSVPKLLNIIEEGGLKRKPKKKFVNMLQKPTKFIFTHLVFRELGDICKEDQLHWPGMCIVQLSANVLKDFPFIATHIGNFDKYNEMDDDTFIKHKKDINVFAKGVGNLKRMPNLTLLRQKIITYIQDWNCQHGSFQHSHELLIKADIPLKYIESVIVYNSDVQLQINNKLTSLKKHIPVKLFPSEPHFIPSVFLHHLTK